MSFGVPEKPMDIFGGWKNYQQLLEENWLRLIAPEDTVVLAGDFSWGMNLQARGRLWLSCTSCLVKKSC